MMRSCSRSRTRVTIGPPLSVARVRTRSPLPGTHAGTRGSGINTNPPCDARHDSRAAPAFAIRVALPLALAVGLVLTLGASVVSAHPDRPATTTTVVACHATVDRTCRRTKPSVL